MKLSSTGGHVVTFVIAAAIGYSVFRWIDGDGVLLIFGRHQFAYVMGIISFGIYQKHCLETIPPNHQAIITVFGIQSEIAWTETELAQPPWPFCKIWKLVPIEHFASVIASQNRTLDGHSMTVFATARCEPYDAYLLTKMESRDGLRAQLDALSQYVVGNYINTKKRIELLTYATHNISEVIKNEMGHRGLYGVKVDLHTTKVIEFDQATQRHFDAIARRGDMHTFVEELGKKFTELTGLNSTRCTHPWQEYPQTQLLWKVVVHPEW